MTPEKRAYNNAKCRCSVRNTPYWKNYGGRGIRFKFTSFAQWLRELGKRPSKKYSIDRIDNDGHYEPGNVRWATKSMQGKNARRRSRAARKRMSLAAEKRCTLALETRGQ